MIAVDALVGLAVAAGQRYDIIGAISLFIGHWCLPRAPCRRDTSCGR